MTAEDRQASRLSALWEEDARRHDEVETLARVAFIAGTASSPMALAEQVGAELVRHVGALGAGVYLWDEALGRFVSLFRNGTRPDENQSFDLVQSRDSIASMVMGDGMARSWNLGDYPEPARQLLAATRFRAVASVPLRSRSLMLGTLNLGFGEERRVDEATLRFLEVAATHVGSAIEALRLTGALRATGDAAADLDSVRAAQAELSRAQAQQARQVHLASLGELTALVAHELRNPLGVLANVVALLRNQAGTGEPAATLLNTAREEIDRMSALVVDLLEYGKPGRTTPAPGSLLPLLHEVAEAARRLPAAGAVRIVVEAPGELPLVEHDARTLYQALLNLASNGVEAMGGVGRLTLRAQPEPGQVWLEVQDTGPGLAGAEGRLFEPFFTTKPTGTGLGLLVVRRVVEAHRGRLEVRSSSGAGTTFALALPVSRRG